MNVLSHRRFRLSTAAAVALISGKAAADAQKCRVPLATGLIAIVSHTAPLHALSKSLLQCKI